MNKYFLAIGECPSCHGGSVGVWVNGASKNLVALCEECEGIWLDPRLEIGPRSCREHEMREIGLDEDSLFSKKSHWADLREVVEVGWEDHIRYHSPAFNVDGTPDKTAWERFVHLALEKPDKVFEKDIQTSLIKLFPPLYRRLIDEMGKGDPSIKSCMDYVSSEETLIPGVADTGIYAYLEKTVVAARVLQDQEATRALGVYMERTKKEYVNMIEEKVKIIQCN